MPIAAISGRRSSVASAVATARKGPSRSASVTCSPRTAAGSPRPRTSVAASRKAAMYTDFYQLSGRPFQLTPDPHFYFDTATHRKAMAYLTYGLSQGEGFIIITGDIGAGKTTLVGHLMETIDRSRLVAAKIVTTQLDADS